MNTVFKTRDKTEADARQRQYYWSLTPYERLALAVRLNQQAQAIYAANPANEPRHYGRRILKSAAPVPRARR